MKTLVIYHGDNCSDGFMAAYIAYLALGKEDVEYVAATYGDPIPDVTGKLVFILDFSYSPEVLVEAAKTASQIHLMDHHKSAYAKWLKFVNESEEDGEIINSSFTDNSYENLTVNFKMNKSGAGMAWEYWKDEINKRGDINFLLIKKVVQAVQDRDLWLKKLEFTEEICAGLNLVKKDFTYYDNVFVITGVLKYYDLVDNGEVVLSTQKTLCESIAKRAKLVTFEGHEVLCVNCNKESSSDVGHILDENKPFSMSYEIIDKKVIVSLRSRPDGLDVSEIATKFGGGGHRGAAGFPMTILDFFMSIKDIEE